jgi:hypothetical protein
MDTFSVKNKPEKSLDNVFFVNEFAMTPQVKIQKFKLREKGVKELGLEEIE